MKGRVMGEGGYLKSLRASGLGFTGLRRWLVVVLIGLATALFAAGCGGGGESGQAQGGQGGAVEGKIQATATTTMIADMVQHVGGDQVEVTELMGPGVDPHLYEPSQGDIQSIQEADAVFYNGLFLEGQMQDVLIQTQNPTVAVSETVPQDRLLPSGDYEGQADPHIWWDAELWAIAVDSVVAQLSELKPDQAQTFEQNGEAYKQEISETDAWVQEQTAKIPEEKRVLVTAHDAYGYFGRAYGFEVRGVQGLSTETEAGAQDVQELADYLAENEIPAIFVEATISRQTVEAVVEAARAQGHEVRIGGELYSDSVGQEGYVPSFKYNVGTMVESLAPEAEVSYPSAGPG